MSCRIMTPVSVTPRCSTVMPSPIRLPGALRFMFREKDCNCWTARNAPASLVVDVCGQEVAGLWPRVGQCRSVVVVLQVGAGLPLPVLPEVLFPAGHAEQLDEHARILAVPVQGPVRCPGPEP